MCTTEVVVVVNKADKGFPTNSQCTDSNKTDKGSDFVFLRRGGRCSCCWFREREIVAASSSNANEIMNGFIVQGGDGDDDDDAEE
jgi:hypothetical protein